ncbi:MAG: hypothetical protein GX647_09320 [Clostridiales bacterium]|jgi:hypothetical protein|nr:hypothetical protein [Clostridiales bacterium]OPZ70001.1 MAG: hypothetical protein BWY81_00154 [Firmicutes bacterium ADurb.Bin467]
MPYHVSAWTFIVLWFLWTAWGEARLRRLRYAMLAVILLASFGSYITAVRDLRQPYSGAKDCAAFVREEIPEDSLLLAAWEPTIAGVVSYLDSDGIYSIYGGEKVTYVSWERKEQSIGGYEALCAWARETKPGAEYVYVLYAQINTSQDFRKLSGMEPFLTGDNLMYRTPKGVIVPSETFAIYRVPVQ